LKSQKGLSLLEVVLALAILGIVGVGVLSAMGGASKATFTADERATAESLARSQMEWIKKQPYDILDTPDDGDGIGTYELLAPADIPVGFTIGPVDPDGLIAAGNVAGNKAGLQKIAFTVTHNGRDILTLEGYKGDR
jgi:prepilin-type N-terminal cleavage/methylation domain-containing protein